MQIAFLRFIDNYLGLLVSLMPNLLFSCQIVEPTTFLLIRPGGIGDAVLLLPMLHQLFRLYPNAKIEVLAERRNAEVFSWSPAVSAVWLYDRPLDFLNLFRRRYDLIIDTEQWYRLSAVVARLLNAPRLIGFATNERSRLFTDPCPYNTEEYEAEMFFKLLAPLDLNAPPPQVDNLEILALPKPAHFFKNPYIVIFPGASVTAKQWPAERFAEVACFCAGKGFDVVVVGGKAESDTGRLIVNASSSCHNLAGKTSLTEAAAIVAGACLMISGDSGLLHIAQLQGVPTVSLFGPSDPKKWCLKGGLHSVVSAGSECAPCSRFGTIPTCYHNFQCMQDITVTMVVEAVEFLLKKNRGNQTDCP